jgi:flavin-binding protein dodecin
MKQAKAAARTVEKRSGRTRTGRNGAIDFALELLDTEAEAATGDHIYRVIEIVGSSAHSIEDAIDAALTRARKTLRNLRWFELVRTSGHINNGQVQHYQVTLKVGFTMEDVAA